MPMRSIVWRVLATLFVLVNLCGAAYAAVLGETLHTLAHAAALLGAYALWRVAARRFAR